LINPVLKVDLWQKCGAVSSDVAEIWPSGRPARQSETTPTDSPDQRFRSMAQR
jgi:hypothetical protein